MNAKGTSLLELIDHFQSLYYICTKGRIQRSQARIFTLKEKLGIVSRRERFHQNFQEFLVDGRVFLHAREANDFALGICTALYIFSEKLKAKHLHVMIPDLSSVTTMWLKRIFHNIDQILFSSCIVPNKN